MTLAVALLHGCAGYQKLGFSRRHGRKYRERIARVDDQKRISGFEKVKRAEELLYLGGFTRLERRQKRVVKRRAT